MKTYLKGFVAIVAIAVVGFALNLAQVSAKESNPKSDNPILAIVNGKEIKRSEVMDVLNGLPIQNGAPLEQIYPMLIDHIINEELLKNALAKTDMKNDPEVKERLVEAKEQIIRAIYLEREVKKRVTDKQVNEEYKDLKNQYKDVFETRARHILVKTEAAAKAIIEKLNKGEDFAALAKEKSTGPSGPKGGDLGYFTKEAMLPAFSKVAFNLKPGKYSKAPVKTQFGWHVIKVEDRRSKPAPKLQEVEASIRGKLGQEALENYVKDLRKTAEIKRFSLDGKPLN